MRLTRFSNVGDNPCGQLRSPVTFTTRDNFTAQPRSYIAEPYPMLNVLAWRYPFQIIDTVIRSVAILVIHLVALWGRAEKCDSHEPMQLEERRTDTVFPEPNVQVSSRPSWLQYLAGGRLPVCAINVTTDATMARNREIISVSIHSNWEPTLRRQHSYSQFSI